MSSYHTPVLLDQAIKYLNIQKNKWYIDCTLGGGGHTKAILEKGGCVLGFDQDPDALNEVRRELKDYIEKNRLILISSNFSKLESLVNKKVAGVLFDLGVSSHQLENIQRGFSFFKDVPLDMRMDPNLSVTAADLINGLHEKELAELFEKYGEEKYAKVVARTVVEARAKTPITTTKQLADIISRVRPLQIISKIHPATRVFQALRIAVNDELHSLEKALPQALGLLEPGGRLVVISFHSLEDRIVKNFFKDVSLESKIKILTDKPIEASEEEISQNPRARSAKLRAIEKN